jgi:hypothetical protein
METIKNATFINQMVLLDGKNFVGCLLANCTLVHAGGPYAHRDCEFRNCKGMLAGDALYTKLFMRDFDQN